MGRGPGLWGLGLAVWVGAMGCSSNKPAKPPAAGTKPAQENSDAHRYFPLKDRTVFAYETLVEGTGERGVLMMQVRQAHSGHFEINVAGRIKRVQSDSSGIRLVNGGYLLKAPIAVNATWQGAVGRVRISQVDQVIYVPAGDFVGCITTVEETPQGSERMTTWYCPDVGMVAMDVESEQDGAYERESLRLKSFGDLVDLSQ